MTTLGFRKLPLGVKFIVGTGAMLLPLVVLAFSAFFTFQASLDSFNSIAEETSAELAPIQDLHINLLKSMLPAHDFLANGSEEERNQFNLLSGKVDDAFKIALKAPFAEPAERNLILFALKEWEQGHNISQLIFTLPFPVGNQEAALKLDRADAYITDASDALDQVYALANEEMQKELALAYSEKKKLLYTIGLVIIMGLTVATVGVITLARSTLIPLRHLEEGTRHIGEGDLTYRVNIDSQDELGLVAEAFNSMAENLEKSQAELKELTVRDCLTGLYNHREFQRLLHEEVERSKRYSRPLSLLMIDIDHFKGVNDTFGHQVGDELLGSFSALLIREVRPIDEVCRYGGEEFAIILPETSERGALATAERIRSLVSGRDIIKNKTQGIQITISVGVSVYPDDAHTEDELIHTADNALYAAKQSGRNRVCRFEKSKA